MKKKLLMLFMLSVMLLSSFSLAYADFDETELTEWKENAVDDGQFTKFKQTMSNLGVSIEAVMKLGVTIVLSVLISFIGLKKMADKSAKSKEDTKIALIDLLKGSFIVFFGLTIIGKLLEIAGTAVSGL